MDRQDRGPHELGFTERDFKVCDFCGALNPMANTECFVCNWTGCFHTDGETVREAMWALESRFGDLTESLFVEEIVPSTPPKQGLWADFWGSIRRLFARG